jgi:post-segregation antitoxin (ccd killing protein)
MRDHVYSWRLTSELKSDLERQARLRKVSISTILDMAVREWLKKSALEVWGDDEQRKLHAAAEKYIGALKGLDRDRAETVRETIRKKLRRRYGR